MEGDVAVYVHWKHHGDDQRTWKPILQLCEDVPARVAKYAEETDENVLTTTHENCLTQLDSNDDKWIVLAYGAAT